MDGIGPADLHITSLVERVEQEPIREIIFALSATIEGDTTGYYIFKKMKNKEDLVISTIAKGISIGNDPLSIVSNSASTIRTQTQLLFSHQVVRQFFEKAFI